METKTFSFAKDEMLTAVNNVANFCHNHCCRIDLQLASVLAMQVVASNNDLYLSKRSFALVGSEENWLAEFDYAITCRTNYFNGSMKVTIMPNN